MNDSGFWGKQCNQVKVVPEAVKSEVTNGGAGCGWLAVCRSGVNANGQVIIRRAVVGDRCR